jgi:hypothetical protein
MNYLGDVHSTTDFVTIPTALLHVATYNISLEVQNFMGMSHLSEIIVQRKNTTLIPQIRLIESIPVGADATAGGVRPGSVRYRWQELRISVLTTVPPCAGTSSQAVDVAWELFKDIDYQFFPKSTSKDPKVFLLPPFSLLSNQTYFLQAVVSIPGVASSSVAQKIKIQYGSSGAVAKICGGNEQTYYALEKFTLTASCSYDFDFPKYIEHLTYIWTCIETYPNAGGTCNAFSDDKNDVNLLVNSKQLKPSHTYNFSVVVTNNVSHSDTHSVLVNLKAKPVPKILIGNVRKKYNVKEKIVIDCEVMGDNETLAVWQSETVALPVGSFKQSQLATTFISPGSQVQLVVEPKTLAAGASYTFAVKAYFNGYASNYGIGKAIIEVNSPPSGGTYEISPTSGITLETSFTMKARDWVDVDVPLGFKFASYTSDPDNPNILRAKDVLPYASAVVGEGSMSTQGFVITLVEVSDVYDGTSEASHPVFVSPAISDAAFAANLATCFSSGEEVASATSMMQCLGAGIASIGNTDCSQAPNCTLLYNREQCSSGVDNTCGPCLPNFAGALGNLNQQCDPASSASTVALSSAFAYSGGYEQAPAVSSKPMLLSPEYGDQRRLASDVGRPCSSNFQCTSKVCNTKTKTCAGTLKICSPPDCNGKGECTFFDKNDKPTAKDCTIENGLCQAKCRCYPGNYGEDCSSSAGPYLSALELRNTMCANLVKTAALQDMSSDILASRLAIIFSVFKDLGTVSNTAFNDCLNAFFQSLTDGRPLIGTNAFFTKIITTLSLALNAGADAAPHYRALLDWMMQAALEREKHIAFGSVDATSLSLANVRLLVTKYSQDILSKTSVSTPLTPVEQLYSVSSNTVSFTSGNSTVPVDENAVNSMGIRLMEINRNIYGKTQDFESNPLIISLDPTDPRVPTQLKLVLANTRNVNFFESEIETGNRRCTEQMFGKVISIRCKIGFVLNMTCNAQHEGTFSYACPTSKRIPSCDIYGLSPSGQLLLEEPCEVVTATEEGITCSCTGRTNYDQLVFATKTAIFNSQSQYAFSLKTVTPTQRNMYSELVLATLLVAVGVFALLGFSVARLTSARPEPEMLDASSFLSSVLPLHLRDPKWRNRLARSVLQNHTFLRGLVPQLGNVEDGRRGLSLLALMLKLLNFCLFATFLSYHYFRDGMLCEGQWNEQECASFDNVYNTAHLCSWDATRQACVLRNSEALSNSSRLELAYSVTLIVTLSVFVFAIQESLLLELYRVYTNHLVAPAPSLSSLEKKVHAEVEYRATDCATLFTNWQPLPARMLRAARATELTSTMDFVSADLEARNLLVAAVKHGAARQFGAEVPFGEPPVPSPGYKWAWVSSLVATLHARLIHAGDWHDYARLLRLGHNRSSHLAIKEAVKQSRKRTDRLMTRMEAIDSRAQLERFIFLEFFAHSLPGIRHFLARRALLSSYDDVSNPKVSPSRLFAVLVLPFLVGFALYFTFFYGERIGYAASAFWWYILLGSVGVDLVLLEVVRVSVLFCLFDWAVGRDIFDLHLVLKRRCKSFLTRHAGVLTCKDQLLQHFNPVCRVARKAPQLVASRVLLSLGDADMLTVRSRQRISHPTADWVGHLSDILGTAVAYVPCGLLDACCVTVLVFVTSVLWSITVAQGVEYVAWTLAGLLWALVAFSAYEYTREPSRDITQPEVESVSDKQKAGLDLYDLDDIDDLDTVPSFNALQKPALDGPGDLKSSVTQVGELGFTTEEPGSRFSPSRLLVPLFGTGGVGAGKKKSLPPLTLSPRSRLEATKVIPLSSSAHGMKEEAKMGEETKMQESSLNAVSVASDDNDSLEARDAFVDTARVRRKPQARYEASELDFGDSTTSRRSHRTSSARSSSSSSSSSSRGGVDDYGSDGHRDRDKNRRHGHRRSHKLKRRSAAAPVLGADATLSIDGLADSLEQLDMSPSFSSPRRVEPSSQANMEDASDSDSAISASSATHARRRHRRRRRSAHRSVDKPLDPQDDYTSDEAPMDPRSSRRHGHRRHRGSRHRSRRHHVRVGETQQEKIYDETQDGNLSDGRMAEMEPTQIRDKRRRDASSRDHVRDASSRDQVDRSAEGSGVETASDSNSDQSYSSYRARYMRGRDGPRQQDLNKYIDGSSD